MKMDNDFFNDKLRMAQWLVFAVIFYALALWVPSPQFQTLCWKLGNVTVFAYAGYWIDRRAFYKTRMSGEATPMAELRRAIIIASTMIAGSLGL